MGCVNSTPHEGPRGGVGSGDEPGANDDQQSGGPRRTSHLSHSQRKQQDNSNQPLEASLPGEGLSRILSRFAADGRVGRTSCNDRSVFKPVFPHRKEHDATHRFYEVRRVLELLRPLVVVPTSSSSAAATSDVPSSSIEANVRAIMVQWTQNHRSPSSRALLRDAAAVPSSHAVPAAALISLAEIDRALRDAPWHLTQCTTNLSSVCIRGFNAVKLFVGRTDADRHEERMDVLEFSMFVAFLAYYLEALVLLDAASPCYEHVEVGDLGPSGGDEVGGGGGGPLAVDGLATSFNVEQQGLERSVNGGNNSDIAQSSGVSALWGGGGAKHAPFSVHPSFFERILVPWLSTGNKASQIDSAQTTPPPPTPDSRQEEGQMLLRWACEDDIPIEFRADVLNPRRLFPELERLKNLVHGGPSQLITTTTTAHHDTSHPHHHQDAPAENTTGLSGSSGNTNVTANYGQVVLCPSAELCDFLARAMVFTTFRSSISS